MKTKLIILVAVLSYSITSVAQQDPQYTQYMYNQAIINPAYAGSTEGLSITALYRNQWSGFEGAPKTMTFSGHSALGNNLGAGLSVIADEHGPVTETNIYADLSYTLSLNKTAKLAFGMKAGVTMHDIALNSGIIVADPGDPLFAEDINKTTPNIGIGAFYYTDNYYIGLSVPNLLNSIHLDENGRKFGSEIQHYFVTAGYVFQLTETTKFKPSVLVKSAFGAPLSYDINSNFLFLDKFEVGASYRSDDSFSGLVGFAYSNTMRIGYAYDHIISDINIGASASHEVFLQFDLSFPKKVSRSPRFF